jgi:hypothetical protein
MCAYKEIWLHGREEFTKFRNICVEHGLLVKNYEDYQEGYDGDRHYPWLPTGEIMCQMGAPVREALRGKTGEIEQQEFSKLTEPLSFLRKQGLPPTDHGPWRGAMWFLSSTELNDVKVSLPSEQRDPVSRMAVNDMDTEAYPSGPTLTKEDVEESLREFFARPRRILTFGVDSASVATFSVNVFGAWSALTGVNKQISQYRLWRGRPSIKVIYSGNPSVMGYVRMAAVPVIEADNYTSVVATVTNPNTALTFTRSSSMPHIDMDLSKPCCCEITLPFPSQMDYRLMTINDWVLHFFELGPMTSADAAITPAVVTFEVYVHYTDMQFLGLTPQGGEGGGPWQSFLRTSESVLSRIGMVFPYANVASKVAGLGADVAGVLGWSRPMLEASDAIVARKHGNTALASGQCDMVMHAGLDPSTGSNTLWSQYPLGKSDDMQVSSMTGRSTHLVRGWVAGAAIACDPTWLNVTYPVSSVIYPTSLAFASYLFDFWRGTLIYKVKVYSSALVRWRIAVLVIPPGVAVPATYSGAADYLTTIIDVVGTTEVEIEVPYLFYTPFASPLRRGVVSSVSTRLVFFPLCAPSGPGATTGTPSVDLWVKGGSDFELASPTADYINTYREAQGKRALYNFGESVENWGLLVKRPLMVMQGFSPPSLAGPPGRFTIPMDSYSNSAIFQVGLVLVESFEVDRIGWSYASYLRRAFLGYNGGSVHRFAFHLTDAVANYLESEPSFCHVFQEKKAAGSYPVVAYPQIQTGFGTGDVVFTKDDFMIEVAFPSRANANFKNAQKRDNDFSVGLVQECVTVQALDIHSVVDTFAFTHIYSAMDDFTMGGLVMIPALSVI